MKKNSSKSKDKILIAVPKGRILDELQPIFNRAKLIPEDDFFNDSSRKLIFRTNLSSVDLIKVRSFDVATFVKFGSADIGICGIDVLEEFPSKEIFPMIDLKIGKCRLVVAGKKNSELNLEKISHIRVATKYPTIAQNYFSNLGIQAEIIKLNGSIEVAPKLGLCEVILDLVSSGKTLLENNLSELKTILDISSYLIVNRTSLTIKNSQINSLIKAFDAN